MEDKVISFKDGSGGSVDFKILDIQFYNDKVYCICFLADNSSTEVYIFRVESHNDNNFDEYIQEENEEIITAVFEKFKEKNKDKYNFE